MARYSNKPITGESEIVWLEDISSLGYVREDQIECHFRQKPIVHPYGKNKAGKVGEPGQARTVGYSVLEPDAANVRPGRFVRRVFCVKEYDRCNISYLPDDHKNKNGYETTAPTEGVDPLTVQPNVAGVMTEKAWGRPFKSTEEGAE